MNQPPSQTLLPPSATLSPILKIIASVKWVRRFFKKTVADSNAPIQDKALDALIAYLKAADYDAGRYAKEVCDAIVAKCLTGRPKTVEKA
ncbi:hypothetical protein L2E82_31924 [Cichorium intybus]|uniref:Uncharacterized protein n=1 Tax=Cichorium intybus TaxID=13427 RepID=A0ACB9BIW6_CICIN|nr:hypothetical protein L2E82_31924 [Cichorium intybus]